MEICCKRIAAGGEALADPTVFLFSSFRLDLINHQLWRNGGLVSLRPKTFAVLRYLIETADRLVTRDELVAAVWGNASGAEIAPKYCIRELRTVFDDCVDAPRFIESVGRVGYRFVAPVTVEVVAPEPATAIALERGATKPALLVGREAELHQLDTALQVARRGEHQVVMVSGEPGIGKTSTVEAFLRRTAGVCVGRGQCIPLFGAGEAYLPAFQALGRLSGGLEPPAVAEILARLAPTWLAQLPALLEALPEAVRPRFAGATQQRMLREIVDALEALTHSLPMVLVLEDLHWADYSTLDFVAAIAHDPRPARLLVIATYRSTELAENHPLRVLAGELIGRGKAVSLPLTGISATAVSAYVEARFANAAVTEALVPLLFRLTAGNPLFLVDLVGDLVAEEILHQADGTWALSVAGESIAVRVPRNSRLLIEKQMTGLAPERRALLEAAGLVGLEFGAESIAAAVQQSGEDVEEHLDAMARQELFLDRCGVEVWPDGTRSARYRFRHPLYQQVWTERLTPRRRQRLHRDIGARLELAYGARSEEIAAALALHFDEGGEFERAVHYRLAAAHNAIRRSGHREAIDHLTTALRRLAERPEGLERDYQELDLRIVLGMALIATRGYTAAEVEENYRRSLELSDRLDDAWHIVQALLGLWPFYLQRGEFDVAQHLAERCAREVETVGDLTVGVHNVVGATAMWRGELVTCRRHLELSTSLHKPELHASSVLYDATNPGVACLAHLGWVLWFLGYPDRALECSRQAIRMARHLDHVHSLSYALTYTATLHCFRREPRDTIAHADEALELAAEHGFPFWQAMGSTVRGWALVASTHDATGLSQMRQGLEMFERLGVQVGRTALLALLAEACNAMGDPAEALRALDDAEARVTASGERFYEAEILRLRGELLRQEGTRAALCERLLREAIEVARRQEAKSWELRAAISLARLRRSTTRAKRSAELLAPVYAWFSEGFDTPDLNDAKSLLDEARST